MEDPYFGVMNAAFEAGQRGDLRSSYDLYQRANDLLKVEKVDINPPLQLTRHAMPAEDPPPGQDHIHKRLISVPSAAVPHPNIPEGVGSLVEGVKAVMDWAATMPEVDMKRRIQEMVFFVSTGRCGTYGLHKLFRGQGEVSYHDMWFSPAPNIRGMALWSLISRDHKAMDRVIDQYITCRLAEMWDAIVQGKRLIIMNHWDSFFVPFWMGWFKDKIKVVYLERNIEDVVWSFVAKGQWTSNVIGYPWGRLQLTEVIAWYLYTTRLLGEAVCEMGAHHVKCEDMFAGEEVLQGYLGTTIGDHFNTKWNEKDKGDLSADVRSGVDGVLEAYNRLLEKGRP